MGKRSIEILLVEDDAAHAELVQRAFESDAADAALTVAGSLKEARARLTQGPPDLLIVDLLLPDGVSTELFPTREEEFEFPVVLMTSHGNEQVAVEAIKAGVLDYVIKSATTLAEMPRIARRALRQWKQIIQRNRAERRLRFLSSAVEQSSEGIAIVDLEGNLLFTNEAFAGMHGYRSDELQGKHLSIFHTPEQMPEVDAANQHLRETGEFSGEIWHARRDGTTFPTLMHNSILRDETGTPVGMIGTLRDITERKRMEQRYFDLVEKEKDVIYTLDCQGRITFANPAIETLTGHTPEESLGKSFMAFIPAELQESAYEEFQQLLRDGEMSARTVMVDKDGREHFVEYNSTVIEEDGRIVGTRGIVRDVTERKLAEEELARHRDHLEELVQQRTAELEETNRRLQREIAERTQTERELRESENRFRTLFETTPHGIVEIDADVKVVACNPAYERMLGYTAAELAGKPLTEIVPGRRRDRMLADVRRTLAEKPEPRAYEVQHVTQDGRTIDCEVAWDYRRDPHAEVVGFVCVVTDITERKRSETALQKEQHLLRQLLDMQEREQRLVAYEIHDGLAQQLAGAQMTFEAFGELIGGVSADSRKVYDDGIRLLSDSLTEARRLISGLRPPILDESGIVSAVEYLIHEAQDRESVTIDFAHNVRCGRLAGPLEAAIFRIVQEGLTNACRYSGADKIRVDLLLQNDRIYVVVEDWGVGFDIAAVEHSRFGLRGIRERARLFEGRATIDSTPGKGTRVSVELPLLTETLDGT